MFLSTLRFLKIRFQQYILLDFKSLCLYYN